MIPRIDAVLVPASYTTASHPYWELAQLAAEFAPLLGTRVLNRILLLDGRQFLPREANATLRFPHGHPQAGHDRYTWTERPQRDGVFYGALRTEEEPSPHA